MKREINSKWSRETANWDGFKYVNRQTHIMPDKLLTMEIVMKPLGAVLQFNGGPTGFESYYIADLIDLVDREELCICAGTVNSWPKCVVKAKDVVDFINDYARRF